MNPSRLGALPGRNALCAALLCVLFCASARLFAAPRKARAPAQSSHAALAPDAFAPSDPAAQQDLQLKGGDEKVADAIAAFFEGIVADDNADTEKSMEQYRRALTLDPSNSALALKVASDLVRRGDFAAAVNILKDAVKYSPRDPLPCLYLSEIYSRQLKKPDQALKYATQALDMDPLNSAMYLAVYEIHAANGDTKQAAQILDRAATLLNTDPHYWLTLGEDYAKLYLKDGQETIPPDGLKKMNGMYEKALALGREDPAVVGKVADFYALSGRVKDAIPLYLGALKSNPDPRDPVMARMVEKLARSYLATGQREQAVKLLEQVIKDNPRRADNFVLLGGIYTDAGETGKALESFQQALKLNPRDAMNYLRVAEAFMRAKKASEAVETMRQARQRFPDLPQITYSLALSLSQAKRHDEALAAFEDALHEAKVTNEEMLNAGFYFNYGAAAEQAGRLEKAAELLKRSIDLDPQNAHQACNYLGYMWVDRGQNLDEAGELIKRAVGMEPENGAYLDSLGWFYFKKGEPKKALAELLKAAQAIKPEDPTVLDHLGDTYLALGDTAQALASWQKALALEADNKKIAAKIENAKQKVSRDRVE
jgi:tetratricopeptide (TPR) repeat protein